MQYFTHQLQRLIRCDQEFIDREKGIVGSMNARVTIDQAE